MSWDEDFGCVKKSTNIGHRKSWDAENAKKYNEANRNSLIFGKFSSEIRIFENRFEVPKLYPIGIRTPTKV